MAKLIGLMYHTGKITFQLDYMSGVAERQYPTVEFRGLDYRTLARNGWESISPCCIKDDLKPGDLAQMVYMTTHIEAWKASPAQIEAMNNIDGGGI